MGLAGFARKATDESLGTICVSSSRRFPSRSGAIATNPVKFPPGRARLLTKPVPIGSPTAAMTTGIVVVVRLTARAAGVPAVTMISDLRAMSSAMSAGKRSYAPSAQRYSIVRSRPST